MRRLRQWLLIFAALVGLMAHVGALRATSLIFAKNPTSTKTTTTEASAKAAAAEETTEVQPSENNTTTKSPLTGIPQIDYIWDPNLPRELNGYNLSEYPFYSTVPPKDEIDFKCEGLHDGFYASVQHKCQVYHHCLVDVRYDFLCANFTAFDQRTFICHFVSEVDCKNSPKYFHRNDALYWTTTTTTTTTTLAPPTTAPPLTPVRPGRPLRRPLRRRRPQVDYYYDDEDYDDDYYEERRNRRRKQRPRQRRPEYDDEYERRTYNDDERYSKRPQNSESEEYDYDRRPSDGPRHRSRPGDKRRLNDEDRLERPKNNDRKRPFDDRRMSSEERRAPAGERRYKPEDRRSFNEERRHLSDRSRVPIINDDRKTEETEDVRRPLPPGRRRFKERRPIYDNDSQEDPDELVPETREENSASVVRPTATGSLFDRPRTPPKILRPVPSAERKKYEYPTKKTTTTPAPLDAEYDDEYEDLPAKPADKKEESVEKNHKTPYQPFIRDTVRRPAPISTSKDEEKQRFDAIDSPNPLTDEEYDDSVDSKYKPYDREVPRNNPKREDQHEDYDLRSPGSRREPLSQRTTIHNGQESSRQTYKNIYQADQPEKSKLAELRSSPVQNEESIKNTKNNDESVKEVRPIVRVVKRPFLPSRGGSPYLPRGLQPVGNSAQKSLTTTEGAQMDNGSTLTATRLLEPNPSIRRPSNGDEYPPAHTGPRTTQPPQVESPRATLDEIYDNEYDVTLNDALNPTLKPIVPNRGLPSGFSHTNKFDRTRYTPPSGTFNNDDSVYSSTDIRRAAIEAPSSRSSSRHSNSSLHKGQAKTAQTYYDDEYDY